MEKFRESKIEPINTINWSCTKAAIVIHYSKIVFSTHGAGTTTHLQAKNKNKNLDTGLHSLQKLTQNGLRN